MINEALLKEGERFDDLERNGYHIIQNPEKFCFGMDAVLLSGFVKAKKGQRVLDMCTGTGIIAILVAAKTECGKITAVEIQEESADMAARSVLTNELTDRIEIINDDIKNCTERFGKHSFDVVTCNPPYMSAGKGLTNPRDAKAVARHEILCDLSDVIKTAAEVLKVSGHFYMVHRPGRLLDIVQECAKNGLEIKRLKFVQPFADKKPNMVLIDAVKGGGRELTVEEPIIVFKSPGIYSDYIKDTYGY